MLALIALPMPVFSAEPSAAQAIAPASRASDPNPPTIYSDDGAWRLYRQWNVEEVGHFSTWLAHIFKAKTQGSSEQQLAKLTRILTDPEMNLLLVPEFAGEPSNPQLDAGVIRSMHEIVDCAKLAFALSSYYAYRRGLPWMIAYVHPADGGDVRTASYNIPGGTFDMLDCKSVAQFFLEGIKAFSTGNFRVDLKRSRSSLSDTVPVAIDRAHLIPGCLYYLDGHVLFLAAVEKYGEPRFLDATTAASRDIYTHNGLNAVTGLTAKPPGDAGNAYAGCFRGFRCFRFPMAEVNACGEVLSIRRMTDDEMRAFGFSTEQYDKMQELATCGTITEGGIALDSFQEWLRMRLRAGNHFTPVADMQGFAREMTALLQQREERVQAAWRDVRENGSIRFPDGQATQNVFSGDGRWGTHSTASFDVSCRLKYFDFVSAMDTAIMWFDLRPQTVDLDGLNLHAIWTRNDLAFALTQKKSEILSGATFTYTNSPGNSVTLSLLDVEQRLYDLSFDPNHPPELRWGAPLDSPEAKTAIESPTPPRKGAPLPMAEAYRREAYYRSLTERDTDSSTLRSMFVDGFTLRQKMEAHIAERWPLKPSPPLVPHNGLVAWLKEQGAAK